MHEAYQSSSSFLPQDDFMPIICSHVAFEQLDCTNLFFFVDSVILREYKISYFKTDKPQSHLAIYFFWLFKIEINAAIANNLKPIWLMKMQCETVYPNIYECVSDYMKIHHDHFWTF